jgi:hypothetical protein
MNVPALPFPDMLADLYHDLCRGANCLVLCDKGWCLPIYAALRERLKARNLRIDYLDGRPPPGTDPKQDVGVMALAVAQTRIALRSDLSANVLALPHLDLMAGEPCGWTPTARELVALLYENPTVQWLGFCDPCMRPLEIVRKAFTRTYEVAARYERPDTPRATPEVEVEEPKPVTRDDVDGTAADAPPPVL